LKCKRPFKVRHFYAERHYIVVCEKTDCNWRIYAPKQKATGKFKITKIVGLHTCADIDLQQRHRQLTSTMKVVLNIEVSAQFEGEDNYGYS
jgi:hypothetical protein